MSVILCGSWANVLSNLWQEHGILLLLGLDVVSWALCELGASHVSSADPVMLGEGWGYGTGRCYQCTFGVASSPVDLLDEFPVASSSVVGGCDGVIIILLDAGRALEGVSALVGLQLGNSSLHRACPRLLSCSHLICVWSSRSHSETASAWSWASFLDDVGINGIELGVGARVAPGSGHWLLAGHVLLVDEFVDFEHLFLRRWWLIVRHFIIFPMVSSNNLL